jgi:hypothetical protein
MKRHFQLGQIVATPRALESLTHADIHAALGRHSSGDWGDVCEEDRRSNDDALRYGLRLLSVFRSASGTKFWIVTESDRSATTVLLPDEY